MLDKVIPGLYKVKPQQKAHNCKPSGNWPEKLIVVKILKEKNYSKIFGHRFLVKPLSKHGLRIKYLGNYLINNTSHFKEIYNYIENEDYKYMKILYGE